MKFAHLVALVALLSLASTAHADNIPWVLDLAEAQKQAAEQQRLVMVHFTAQNCGPCRLLERGVYSRPEFVRALLANYIPVKIDGPANPGLVKQFQIRGWPTDVFLTPDGVEVFRDTSPQDMNQYIGRVDQIAAHARAGMTNAIASTVQAGGQYIDAGAQAVRQQIDRASQFIPPNASQGIVNQFVHGQQAGAQVPIHQPIGQAPVQQPQPQPSVEVTNPYVQAQLDHIRKRNERMQAGIDMASAVNNTEQSAAAAQPRKQPKLALDGFCPVAILNDKQWVLGNTKWGHIHRGKLYLFSSEEAKAKFWEDPDRYSPVMGGYDIVQYIDGRSLQDGSRDFACYYRNRYYLFATAASRAKFESEPDYYADKANLAIAEHDAAVMRR